MDWLEDTYNRSIGFCQPVSETDLVMVAELTAECERQMGGSLTDAATIMEQLKNPFLTNFRSSKDAEAIYERAAELTRATIRFGAAFKDLEGYTGLYSDDKGVLDLGEFWKAVRQLEEEATK